MHIPFICCNFAELLIKLNMDMDCKEAFEKYYGIDKNKVSCTCEQCERDSYTEKISNLLDNIELHEDNIETKEEWIEAFRETIDRLEDKIIEYKDKIAMSRRIIQSNKEKIKEVN